MRNALHRAVNDIVDEIDTSSLHVDADKRIIFFGKVSIDFIPPFTPRVQCISRIRKAIKLIEKGVQIHYENQLPKLDFNKKQHGFKT